MIAYEDLVSALAMWRERNGLPVGAADYLGEPPAPEPVSFAAYESRPAPEGGEDFAVEDIPISDELAAVEGEHDEYGEWTDPVPADEQLAAEPASEDLTADPWGNEEQPTEPPADELVPPIDDAAELPADDPWAAQAADVGVELAPDGEVAEAPVSYDEYPAVGEATLHEATMDEHAAAEQLADEFPAFADEAPPAGDEMSYGDLEGAEPVAPDGFELPLGDETSTVDEDVAVIASTAPQADELPPLPQAYEGDSTAPVDPVAEPLEETHIGVGVPDSDEPPQS